MSANDTGDTDAFTEIIEQARLNGSKMSFRLSLAEEGICISFGREAPCIFADMHSAMEYLKRALQAPKIEL